ncbi:MipA/OmpV family protein [Acuticoccus sp.]|uniref:MipA/OmpV family protein n=1 Tax=Acuticoccus sp. TaxID=1904378 RepID=UPI003B515764
MARCVWSAVFLAATGPVMAADLVDTVAVPEAVEYRDIVIDLGLGAAVGPEFPSAKDYIVTPWPIARLRFLRLPVFGEVVTGQEQRFTLYPSFDFIGERDEDDADYLDGVGDTDFAVELGAGAAVRFGFMRAFAEVRYGVTGHDGFVGEAGLDFVYDAHDRFEFRVGPRVSAATDDYMDIYFSVPERATQLDEFDADGGFKDVGIEAQAIYALTERWRLHGQAEYTHFVGDALDSPIVEEGNDDEFTVRLGLTYRFGLDLY